MNAVVTFPAGTPAPATLIGAIAAVMAEVHIVAKRGVNEFHRYQYATMGDILKEITPLLGRHGIVIFQSETGRAMFDEDSVIAVEYAFTVAHVSGERWPEALRQTGVSTCRNSKGGWDDKSLNKCHTAARKYFLLALFQIPTGDEADADQGESFDKGLGERPAKSAVRTVVPAPKRALQQGGIADRADREWQRPAGPSKAFVASQAGQFNERNPPPRDDIPEFLDRRSDPAKALNRRLHPMNDELPGDLGPPKAEASYLDLVNAE